MTLKRRSGTHIAIASQITNKRKPRTLTFREILNIEDLKKCFRLRYQRYDNPEYRLFLTENIHQLDIDPFDRYSRHWAVYSDENEILGYARIVQQTENPVLANAIQQLIDECDITFTPIKKKEYRKFNNNNNQKCLYSYCKMEIVGVVLYCCF